MFKDAQVGDCLLITYIYKEKLERTNYFVIKEIITVENETVYVGELRTGHEYKDYRVFVDKENMNKEKFISYDLNIPDTYTIVSTTNLRDLNRIKSKH